MKLVIQIPAWNEEEHLPTALADLPNEVPGFDEVDVQVVDDGSTDKTAEVAHQHGARVVSLGGHRGLAAAFAEGIRAAVRHGADVIVNTDADSQYAAEDIPHLVQPILDNEADMVIGNRQIETIEHFSFTKKLLQRLGSAVVRRLSHTQVQDATSGFRAISRRTALRLHVFTRFTYTLETILQAGEAGLRVVSVPIRINPGVARPSRLFRSNLGYIVRSLESMARIVVLYNPLRIFVRIGSVPFAVGILLILRFLFYYVTGHSPAGHLQSLLLAVILVVVGVQIWITGLVADLIAVNRRLLEELLVGSRDRASSDDR